MALRCQIVLQAAKGRSSRVITEALGCSRSWASRVIERFMKLGEAALMDGREDNGALKLGQWYLGQPAALASCGGRIVLHFLPPYCPNANTIERLWKDLHDQVTRSHEWKTIKELMREVRHFVNKCCIQRLSRSRRVAA